MTAIGPAPEPPRRYRNEFRWCVMPPETAAEAGLFDRSFGNKQKALEYQKQVKARFPKEPCTLCDTGRYFDHLGRSYATTE